jgi:hypothetical protein
MQGLIEFNDTAHGLDEFCNFSWDQLDANTHGVSRGGIVAGMDFNPVDPHIDFHDKDGNRDAWAIPWGLYNLLERYKQDGRRQHANALRSLIEE